VETTHEALHLEKMKLGTAKDMDMPASFILIIIVFGEAFKYGGGAKI
jgi:hypothetical protein